MEYRFLSTMTVAYLSARPAEVFTLLKTACGWGKKMLLLIFIQFTDRAITSGHFVTAVSDALPQNLLVECFHARGFWNRNHVIAPRKANQPLNATLFVTAVWVTETGYQNCSTP